MVEGHLLRTQLHHARGYDDAPAGEMGKHIQRGLGSAGIAVERIVDDRNAARAAQQLQTVLHRLKLADTALQLGIGQAQMPGDRTAQKDVADVVRAQQPGTAGNARTIGKAQGEVAALIGYAHVLGPYVAALTVDDGFGHMGGFGV